MGPKRVELAPPENASGSTSPDFAPSIARLAGSEVGPSPEKNLAASVNLERIAASAQGTNTFKQVTNILTTCINK